MTVVDRREVAASTEVVSAPSVASTPRRNAGLDGLRGVAVAAVVVFHLGRLQGGFLGVDLFFVLSGFLITSLLLGEVAATGRVGLGGFWSRRARRLLPALLVVMSVTGGLLRWLTPEAERARFRGDGLATLGYVANWPRVFSQRSYWDMFAQASPFDHMWSLAIEEQFYAGWPLLVVAVAWLTRGRAAVLGGRLGDAQAELAPVEPGGRRLGVGWGRLAGGLRGGGGDVAQRVGVLAGIGAAVSLAWLAWSYDPFDSNWAYFSTPTRLGPVLAGSALAAFTVARPSRDVRGRWTAVGGLVGLVVVGWLIVDINGTAAHYYRGGLVLFTLACLAAVHSVARHPDGPLARALSFTPLRLLGLVSYGVYLWHWPVIVFLTPERAHISGVPLDVLRVVVVLVAATVSYLVVELPVRHGAPAGRRLAVVAAPVAAVALVATVVGTSGKAWPQFSDIPDGPLAGTDTIYLHVPETVPPDAQRVLLVGDSGPQFLGPSLVDAAAGEGAAVAFSSEIECTAVVPEGLTLQPNGTVERYEPCQDHRITLWQRLVDEYDPDVVVYYLANAGGLNKVRLDGEWVRDCDAAYDAYLASALRSDVEMLSARGARVVFTTAPYVAVIDDTSKARTDCRNSLVRDIAASHPNTEVVDLQSFVIEKGAFREGLFVDSFHFSPKGGSLVADWLLPQILK